MSTVHDPRETGSEASIFAGTTVLVVDDHPANVVLLQRILTKAGVAHLHTSRDPREVVSLFRSTAPDLVLLDLHMPGMDGVAVMHALREATDADDFVPLIVLTADATAEARERVLAAGANDFLTKPFDHTEVTLRAQNLLHRRALHVRLRDDKRRLRDELNASRAADEHARRAIEERRGAIETLIAVGAPRIVFQPIADLASQAVIGYEALARFDVEPRRTPDIWFAEAAGVGLGTDLELAAVRTALRSHDDIPDGVLLTLNVAPETAMTRDLAELLSASDPSHLALELTEHVAIEEYGVLLDALDPLRELGVRLVVDDAGAGFASLQHILRLQPDVIKLDIALTRDIDHDPVKRALASSLVTFSHEIGSTLVAEGIETAAELQCLVDLGVPWGQGYHLGRPDDLAVHARLQHHPLKQERKKVPIRANDAS